MATTSHSEYDNTSATTSNSENINISHKCNSATNNSNDYPIQNGRLSPCSPTQEKGENKIIEEGVDGINLVTLNISSSSGSSKDVTTSSTLQSSNSSVDVSSSDQDEMSTMAGETVQYIIKEIQYLCPTGIRTGKLTLTNYKLFFQSFDDVDNLIIHLPLGLISKVKKIDRQERNRTDISNGFDVICKDIRDLRFQQKREQHAKVKVVDKLQQLVLPLMNQMPLFAYEFREQYKGNIDSNISFYDPISEFKRQGLPNESWKISRLNDKYQLCETYPSIICVPAASNDEEVRKVAEFRSKGRLPVLSWMHPLSQATILRSSQPLTGLSVKRSSSDETYLQRILDVNAHSHKLCIFDARPKINAIANKTLGGGYESEENYANMEIIFLDIQNIHSMRSSYQKLKEVCFPSVDENHFLSNIEKSGWLFHIKQIIAGSLRVANSVESNKTSVLVHCSDGWDRTAQLTGLAMIMLDPYYRSINGFMVLIEKEWLSFGHQFANRLGHSQEPHEQMSPVFVQFIDCVWQITRQFPNAFEFNEAFLLSILEHIYSCLFGTFLENCEMKRKQQNIQEKTVSFWAYLNTRRDSMTNALYAPFMHSHVLYPIASMRRLRVWNAYYLSWNRTVVSQDPGEARNAELLRLKASLQRKVQDLSGQLNAKNAKLAEISAVRIALPN